MLSRRRLITRGLKLEDIKCDLPKNEIECDDCGVITRDPYRSKRGYFCEDCAPYYKREEELDRILIDQDLLRKAGVTPPRKSIEEIEAELDFGEGDYWDWSLEK